MGRCSILNGNRGRPEPFCLSMVPNALNLFISHATEVLSQCSSGLCFQIVYAVYPFSR